MQNHPGIRQARQGKGGGCLLIILLDAASALASALKEAGYATFGVVTNPNPRGRAGEATYQDYRGEAMRFAMNTVGLRNR